MSKHDKPDRLFTQKIKSMYSNCFGCGKADGWAESMTVHHLLCKNAYPEFRHHPSNGILLCFECHRRIHDKPEFRDLVYDKHGLWSQIEDMKSENLL